MTTIYTPGIEVSSSVVLEGDASVTHTVCKDGNTEITFGGRTGLLMLLSEETLRKVHEVTGAAVKDLDRLPA